MRQKKGGYSFRVFKTVKLGTGPKTVDEFRQAIEAGGMKIGDWADDILKKVGLTVATEGTEVDLVVVTVARFTFKDGAKREDIYARAKSRGLQLCAPEVALQLRLQYADQPKGEWLVIGTEPITGSDGSLRLFGVGRDDDGLWLDGYCDSPGSAWAGDYRFVFSRRK